jgi:hypothetical protein
MSKRVIKNGPQLTGAQALDAIIEVLESSLIPLRNAKLGSYRGGLASCYKDVIQLVSTIRYEKFDDPKTEDPLTALGESKSFAI